MQSQSSDGNVVLLQESPAFSTPKVEKDDVVLHQHQYQDGKIFLLPDLSASNDVQNLVISIQNDQQVYWLSNEIVSIATIVPVSIS